MKERMLAAVAQFSMLCKGDAVLCALSGGADSCALLHALLAERERLGITVRALHVNHNLRGEESARDEQFVRTLCRKWNVPLEVVSVDVAALAAQSHIGLEECGRNVRYDALHRSALQDNAKIATAHTLSDAAETLLLNITRGSTVSGAKSIPPVRERIVRPLILASRAMVEQYCCDNGIEYVTDSSNLSCDYTRNRIRNRVMPVLREINSQFDDAALRFMGSAREDDDYISSVARSEYATLFDAQGTASAPQLASLHTAVLGRVLVMHTRSLGCSCTKQHIDEMIALLRKGAGQVQLPQNMQANVLRGIFSILPLGQQSEEWSVSFDSAESILPDGRRIRLEHMTFAEFCENLKINKFLYKNALDCDTIQSNALIRNRRQGDTVHLCNRPGKQLRRLFAQSGIPSAHRGKVALVESDGVIAWVEGFGVCQGFAPGSGTRKVCIIHIEEK